MLSRPSSSLFSLVGRTYRLGLVVLAALLVAGAFARVAWRESGRLLAGPDAAGIELVLMHWSG
ncbi:MAG: hypothetical protein VX672_01560, partial [Planctomycetota bacterium]|nr:hypothetical protein [Planctomycetota bacterium]